MAKEEHEVIKQLPLKGEILVGPDPYASLKDSMGRFRTQSLFVEMKHDKYPAPFTLKRHDHRGSISMYEKYMEIGDPTEYSQAIGLLGSWKHWQVLTACAWFKPYINEWRDELKTKFESDRFREMEDVAKTAKGTPAGVSATKWLAERYSKPETPKRGRPSAAEKAKYLKESKEEEELSAEDAARLGL